jgi:hypothetical protein
MNSDKKCPFKEIIGYYSLVNSGKEQPQTTHGDRYDENRPSISSYVKGSIFLSQLNYVIGKDKLAETKRYFHDFKFKHPTPNDIKDRQNVFLELI